mgnify:CR=1 FL=1
MIILLVYKIKKKRYRDFKEMIMMTTVFVRELKANFTI